VSSKKDYSVTKNKSFVGSFAESVKDVQISDETINKLIESEVNNFSYLSDFVDILWKKFFEPSCQGKVIFLGLDNCLRE
jgi:hypothetical protein